MTKKRAQEAGQENCIRTLRLMSGNQGLTEMPHYDTLNYYLEKLSPECLSELRKKMVVIQGDALYATKPMMQLCRVEYHWE